MDFTWVTPTDQTPLTTKGDLFTFTTVDARLPLGTTGQVLKVNTATATGLEWGTDSAGMTNPMTTTGDTIYSSSGSTPARLGIGSTGQVLTVAGGVPSWATPAGGGGKVLQVVNAVTATAVDSSSTSYVDTNLTATITPTLSTSKILVLVHQKWNKTSGNANQGVNMRLMRGATQILEHTLLGYTESAIYQIQMWSVAYYDSPATTSATTYKTQLACNVAAASIAVNGGSNNASITLLEIGA
jgi:hypothetical protein